MEIEERLFTIDEAKEADEAFHHLGQRLCHAGDRD